MSGPWERQPWAEPYWAAILESDENRLFSQIELARKAIHRRIAELWCSPSARCKDTGEMGAIIDALNVLRRLEKEKFPRKTAA